MRRYLVLLPVYLLSTSIPLLTTFGSNLEYEYALLCSYLALVLIPVVGLAMPARYLPVDGAGAYAPPLAFEVFWIFLISPLVALLSGGARFAAGLCPCSASGFGFWMLVVWYPAWVLAHAVLHAVLRGRTRGFGRGLLGLTLGLCYVAILSVAFADLWLQPQKRLVNLVAGFLHGPIYDDWIAVDSGLLLARSAHLAVATMLLLLVWYRRSVVLIGALVLSAAAWIATGTLANNFHSTKNDKRDLDQLLYQALPGTGFTLHYRPAPTAKGTPVRIQRLFRDAEFEVGELTKILGQDGTPLPKVEIYVYPDDDRKKLWFGGGSTDVTDVHTPSIHISATSWPHPTLRHELVHALASGFGYHGLGFHPNMAFTEGLAVALAPSPAALSLDDGAASILSSGRIGNLDDLFSPAFWKVSGGRAYTVAGSLIRYLIDKYGIASVKALYAGKSWDDAIHENRESVLAAWQEKILKGYDKDKNAIYTEALFRYPGVLHDLCPHSKADLARSRDDGPYTRLRQPIGWDPDSDYLTWLMRLDPDDAETRVRAWKSEIKHLALDRFPPPGRLSTWREALAKGRTTPPATIEDVELGILESDVARLLGDIDGSVQILKGLQDESRRHSFGDSILREIETRLAIEAGAGGTQSLAWRRYLAGWQKLPDANVQNGPWLLSYLKLRNERETKLTTGDIVRLLTEMAPDQQLPPTFQYEWYKLIAGRLMRAGAYKEAAVAFSKAAAAAGSPATREVFEEHMRRAEYYAQKGALKAGGDEEDDKDKATH